jgi:hypothetical protein
MAVEIEQGKVFAARRQRFVAIEPLMIHTHDPLIAPVEFTEPVPALHGWSLCRPDHSFPLSCTIEPLLRHRVFQPLSSLRLRPRKPVANSAIQTLGSAADGDGGRRTDKEATSRRKRLRPIKAHHTHTKPPITMLATTSEMLATIQNMNNTYNMDWAPQNLYQMPQSVYSG